MYQQKSLGDKKRMKHFLLAKKKAFEVQINMLTIIRANKISKTAIIIQALAKHWQNQQTQNSIFSSSISFIANSHLK